jgi:hypothetical protein
MELNRKKLMEVGTLEHSLLNNLRFSEKEFEKTFQRTFQKEDSKSIFQKYLSGFISQVSYLRFRI